MVGRYGLIYGVLGPGIYYVHHFHVAERSQPKVLSPSVDVTIPCKPNTTGNLGSPKLPPGVWAPAFIC